MIDKFHEKDSQLYQVMERAEHSNEVIISEVTPGPLAEALANEMPEVEYATNVPDAFLSNSNLSANDKTIKAAGQCASDDYFNVFSYPIIDGNKDNLLNTKNSIVISEEVAVNLFNTTQNVVGKTLEFQKEKQYLITGIFKKINPRSSVQFDFVVPYRGFVETNPWALTWGSHNPNTFLILKKGTDINNFNKKIKNFVKEKFKYSDVTLFVRPYSEGYLYNRYENGILVGGRIEYVKLFSCVAVFILLIACINFMNLSTAKASRRLKEVGIKKAVGAGRGNLVVQFMGESMLLTFVSLLIAIALVWFFLPQFNQITGKQLVLNLEIKIVLAVIGIALFTGLVSGSYPAMYLSGFKPVAILKGKLQTTFGEVLVRKGLVVFQFTLSLIFIIAVVVVYQQIQFIQSKNLGYDKNNIIYFENEGKVAGHLETFVEEVKKLPGIANASSIRHLLNGHMNSTSDFEWEGKTPETNIEFEHIGVRYGMIETLNIKFKEGRSFSKQFPSDTSKIVFNEAAIQAMGLKDPIGKVIQLHQKPMQIIGVTENFHFQSLHETVHPAFFRITPRAPWYIMAKIESGKENQAIPALKKFYEDFNPGFEFDYKFLDEEYQSLYASEQRVASLSQYFAAFAVMISCLGLFGLAAFSAERRLKEIGIRKVLGSSVGEIVILLSTDFTNLVITAIFIGIPISYLIAINWLENYAYSIDLKWWYFAGAAAVALVISWLTVATQAIKAAKANPVQSLKND
jgi:putative ABC transport system permease protein